MFFFWILYGSLAVVLVNPQFLRGIQWPLLELVAAEDTMAISPSSCRSIPKGIYGLSDVPSMIPSRTLRFPKKDIEEISELSFRVCARQKHHLVAVLFEPTGPKHRSF